MGVQRYVSILKEVQLSLTLHKIDINILHIINMIWILNNNRPRPRTRPRSEAIPWLRMTEDDDDWKDKDDEEYAQFTSIRLRVLVDMKWSFEDEYEYEDEYDWKDKDDW